MDARFISPLDILIFSLCLVLNLGSHVNDSEHRLIKDLLRDYKKDSRPVFNKSEAVKVELDVAYSQLVDLVRRPFLYSWHAQKWYLKRAIELIAQKTCMKFQTIMAESMVLFDSVC